MAKLTFNTLGPSPLPQTVIDDPNFALVTPSADFYEQTVEVMCGEAACHKRIVVAIEWLPAKCWGASEETLQVFRDRGGSDVVIETDKNKWTLKCCYISPPEGDGSRFLIFKESALMDDE